MASAIDATKPTEGTATTLSVRDNFAAAKTEIEDLQSGVIEAGGTANEALAAAIEAGTAWRTAYPIGSLYLSTLTANPSTYLGFGTWVAFGAGKVLVGLDPEDPDFDTVEATGGEKAHTLTEAEMPEHTHVQNPHTHVQNPHSHSITLGLTDIDQARAGGGRSAASGVVPNTNAATATNQNSTATNQNAGGGESHNNLQPYIVVLIWKRTS